MRKHEPSFRAGDQARLMRSLPPVLSGSLVLVVDMHTSRSGVRYQVESVEYPAPRVWAEEGDLSWPLLDPVG